MAEGGAVKGVFEEREEQDRERSAVPSGADPIATTLAIGPAPDDPALARRTGDYLERQDRLVEKQERLADLELRHFDLEHRLGIGEASPSGAYFAHWSKRSGQRRVVSDNYVALACAGPAC